MKILKGDVEQMRLGSLIKLLESLEPNQKIYGLGEMHSYRGYYEDLEFERTDEYRTVESILIQCVNAIGEYFEGYKGGEYEADASTLLWVGCEGIAIGEKLYGFDITGMPIVDGD
jgi:hypothetical protein